MISISINSGTASKLYNDLIKTVTISGTRTDESIELNSVVTSHYSKDKYITNGPVHITNTINSLFSVLSDKNHEYTLFLERFLNTNDNLYCTPFGYVNIINKTLSLTALNHKLNVLDFGNVVLFFSTLMDLMISAKNLTHGSLVLFSNNVYIDKQYYNYYQEVENSKAFYYKQNPLTIESLEDLYIKISKTQENNLDDTLDSAWRDLQILNMFNNFFNSGYYDDAKSLLNLLSSNSFEKLWASRVVNNVGR